jgi:hypothetical protein
LTSSNRVGGGTGKDSNTLEELLGTPASDLRSGAWSSAEGAFKQMLSEIVNLIGGIGKVGTNTGILPAGQTFSSQTSAQQVNPAATAKLDLKMESTTNLLVDGRILATIMKPFFASDLLRAEAAQGTITKRYII